MVDGAEPGAIFGEFISEGEVVGVVPVVEIAFDGSAGGELAVEEEVGSAVGGARESDVRAHAFEGGSGIEGWEAVGAGTGGAESDAEFVAVLAKGDVSVGGVL